LLKIFKNILNDSKSEKKLTELATRDMDKFSKMLDKINGFN